MKFHITNLWIVPAEIGKTVVLRHASNIAICINDASSYDICQYWNWKKSCSHM